MGKDVWLANFKWLKCSNFSVQKYGKRVSQRKGCDVELLTLCWYYRLYRQLMEYWEFTVMSSVWSDKVTSVRWCGSRVARLGLDERGHVMGSGSSSLTFFPLVTSSDATPRMFFHREMEKWQFLCWKANTLHHKVTTVYHRQRGSAALY